MDWMLLIIILPFAVFAWWAGFFATKRMRLEKNREREEAARRYREAQQNKQENNDA